MLVMEASSVFAAFDKDGNGKVSASELRCGLASTLGEDVSAILAAVDADGLLNQEEFSRLGAGAQENDDDDVKRRCLMEAFGMYASSSSLMEDTATTMIMPASLRRTLSRLGSHELGVEERRAMICRFDLDGDGALISFDEFRVMMMA